MHDDDSLPCPPRRWAGRERCYFHPTDSTVVAGRKAACQAGGRAAHRAPGTLDPDAAVALDTVGDVMQLLEQTPGDATARVDAYTRRWVGWTTAQLAARAGRRGAGSGGSAYDCACCGFKQGAVYAAVVVGAGGEGELVTGCLVIAWRDIDSHGVAYS